MKKSNLPYILHPVLIEDLEVVERRLDARMNGDSLIIVMVTFQQTCVGTFPLRDFKYLRHFER
jgi:hypothetical protein